MNVPRPAATIIVGKHSAVVATLRQSLPTGRHRLYAESDINDLLAEIARLKNLLESKK